MYQGLVQLEARLCRNRRRHRFAPTRDTIFPIRLRDRAWRCMVDSFLELQNRHSGEILRMHRVRDASGQTVLIVEGSLPPGKSGPPPHVHFRQREEVVVKAGVLGARVGKEKVVVPAGGSAVFPAGVVHSWWNAGR